jgi:hypothetical protein
VLECRSGTLYTENTQFFDTQSISQSLPRALIITPETIEYQLEVRLEGHKDF